RWVVWRGGGGGGGRGMGVGVCGAGARAMPLARQGGTGGVEPGFTSLFNGTDLAGWKIAGPLESFSVKDGAIVAGGEASHAFYDGPVGNHSFRNFELKIDVMTRQGSNGGVYVLSEVGANAPKLRAQGRSSP